MVDKVTESEIDKIIEKLLSARQAKSGKVVNLAETQIKNLCIKSREIFL